MANGLGKLVKAGALTWALGSAETIFKKPTTVYLALLTAEATYGLTGAEVEAKEPTGVGSYARHAISVWEIVEGETAEIRNKNTETFTAFTGAGTAKIKGWALLDAATAGNLIAFGSVTEVEISKTASPAVVEAQALKITLK